MKYCFVAGKENIEYQNDVDELIYNIGDELINQKILLDIVYENTKKNIVSILKIHLNDQQDFNKMNFFTIKKLKEDHQLIKVLFTGENMLPIKDNLLPTIQGFLDNKIDFYFDFFVTSYQELNAIMKLGISDIKIGGDLCFDIFNVSALTIKNGVDIRITPNIFLCLRDKKNGASVKINEGFFIRPEDLYLYDALIDTIEFSYRETVQEQAIFYEAYALKKKWTGPINEIIIESPTNILNYKIMGDFGKIRLSCRQKCIKGGMCNICGSTEQLARSLESTPIYFRDDKN